MKKILYLLMAFAVMSVAASCAQSGDKKDGKDSVDQQYMEDINAGEEPVTLAEEAAATEQSGIATMDERAAVADLTNDNAYRPDTKVNRVTVLDFNATWCGPCKKFAPAFEKAAEVYGNQVDFYSVDVDQNPQTAKAFGVESIPTVVFILPDGTIKTYVGTADLLSEDSNAPVSEKFEKLVKSYL